MIKKIEERKKRRRAAKFWTTFIILLALGLTVFFIGWGQFAVPAGSCGVMISKTRGINKKPIVPGEFSWYWERLIPTNVKIRKFVLKPCITETEVSNVLPSGILYAEMMEGNPDFSYEFNIITEIGIKPSMLPDFVKRTDASTDEELTAYLEEQSEKVAKAIVDYLLKESIKTSSLECFSYDLETITKGIKTDKKFKDLDITDIQIETITMPDVELYNIGKKSYSEFQAQVKQAIVKISKNQSLYTAEDYIQLERFSRWGKILTEYPILIEFMKVADPDVSAIFKSKN